MELELFGTTQIQMYPGVADSKLYLVDTLELWQEFFSRLMKQRLVACDTETSGFHWFRDHHVVGLSFGWGREDNYYIPLRHESSVTGGDPGQQIDIGLIKADLCSFFAQKDIFTIWHHAKFDKLFYLREGIEVLTPFHDTAVLWQLHDENSPNALKTIASGRMDELGRWQKGIISSKANEKEKEVDKWRGDEAIARRNVYKEAVKFKALELIKDPENQGLKKSEVKKLAKATFAGHPFVAAKKEDIHYGYIPIPLMTEYAALDTFFTFEIFKFCMKEITWTQRVTDLYINEIKLSEALQGIEYRGIHVDANYLRQARETLWAEECEVEARLKEALGDINFNSTQQLTKALLGVGVVLTERASEESENFCLDKDVLAELELEGSHPVIPDIVKLRLLRKLRTTYVESILAKITDDKVLRCSFNQNVTTGRMSIREPNLSNIPGRDDTIRKGFVGPGDDYVYVFADYSQVEVRLTAHFSEDPLLMDAYARGQDVHTRTMCEVHGHFYEEVIAILGDKDHPLHKKFDLLRTAIKRTVFGIVYSVGPKGLSKQIKRPEGVTKQAWVNQCEVYIDSFLDKYLNVKRFINASYRMIKQDAQVVNVFGRVRRLPHAKAVKVTGDYSKKWLEARAQRQGTNYIIQSAAADVFKIAVVRIDAILKGKKSYLVNLVHDEVQLYMHKSELHLLKVIKAAMEDFPQFKVPLLVDFSYTKTNWAEKQKIK